MPLFIKSFFDKSKAKVSPKSIREDDHDSVRRSPGDIPLRDPYWRSDSVSLLSEKSLRIFLSRINLRTLERHKVKAIG